MKNASLNDEELISEDWLRSVGFDDCKPCHVFGTPNCNWWNDRLRLEIWPFNDSGEWLWVECDSVPMRRCRDLQLLMDWVRLRWQHG